MKNLILTLVTAAFALSAQAKTIEPSAVKLDLSSVDQVIRLVDQNKPGSSQKKLNLVITDTGMSTDVSPRGGIYLALASLAEMGNISAEYTLTETMFRFISAKRTSPGVFEVKYVSSENLKEVTMKVDARKLLIDEKKRRSRCDDFCDGKLNSPISVTEAAGR